LKRYLKREPETPLSRAISAGDIRAGASVAVEALDGVIGICTDHTSL